MRQWLNSGAGGDASDGWRVMMIRSENDGDDDAAATPADVILW